MNVSDVFRHSDLIVAREDDLSVFMSEHYWRKVMIAVMRDMMPGTHVELSVSAGGADAGHGVDGYTVAECTALIAYWLAMVPGQLSRASRDNRPWSQLMADARLAPDLEVIMWHLCFTKIIPAGRYLIVRGY